MAKRIRFGPYYILVSVQTNNTPQNSSHPASNIWTDTNTNTKTQTYNHAQSNKLNKTDCPSHSTADHKISAAVTYADTNVTI